MAEKLIAAAIAAPSSPAKLDDDFADRLSYLTTVKILITFAIMVSLTAYVGTPIVCWAPNHFTKGWTIYTNSYCWIRNTYYLPWEDETPAGGDGTHRQMVTYYQWIPFILLFQATLFYAPNVVWHALNSKAGVDCDDILKSAHKITTAKVENQDEHVKLLVNQMKRFLGVFHKKLPIERCKLSCPPQCCGTCCGKRFGNYLVILFIFTKLLFIANVIAQFFWLNRLLNFNFNTFGWDFLRFNIDVENHDWTELSHVAFPRVTMCDLEVRRLGNVHPYALQCTLPINLYTEKMYVFLWFWFCFIASVSILSLIVWILRAVLSNDRVKFIRNHLDRQDLLETDVDRALVGEFVREHLRQDGVFILRLIAQNVDGLTATEFCCELWRDWREMLRRGTRQSSLEEYDVTSEDDVSIEKTPLDSAYEEDEVKRNEPDMLGGLKGR